MAPVRILVSSFALAMAACVACRDGSVPPERVDVAPPTGEEALAVAPDSSRRAALDTAARSRADKAPHRIGYFRTALGLWELDTTGAGARYSLYDHDGTPIATGVSQDALEELDPTFAETMETGVARAKSTLYVENYGIGVERAGREMETPPAGAATMWDASVLER